MSEQRVALSLRIRHPERDLSDICSAIGAEVAGAGVKRIWRKDEERSTPKGTKLDGVYKEFFCGIDLGPTSQQYLTTRMKAALAELKPYRDVFRDISGSGGKIEFFAGLFCEGDTGQSLDISLLDAMTDMRISLELCIYMPGTGEQAL